MFHLRKETWTEEEIAAALNHINNQLKVHVPEKCPACKTSGECVEKHVIDAAMGYFTGHCMMNQDDAAYLNLLSARAENKHE